MTMPTGVLPVLATPFDSAGNVDHQSLIRLIEHQLRNGVDGIVCFGLASETFKLTDAERLAILRTARKACPQDVPLIVGVEHASTHAALGRARQAVEEGATALMAYPPSFLPPSNADLRDYYTSLSAESGGTVIIQDAPAWSRVSLPVDLLVGIAAESPNPISVKVESPPTADKIRALREAGISCYGGYGGLNVAEEHDAGVAGFMPGCGTPALMVRLWEHLMQGEDFWSNYGRTLPLLAFQMNSLELFVAAQKHMLQRFGVINCELVRRPGAPLSEQQRSWLERLLSVIN